MNIGLILLVIIVVLASYILVKKGGCCGMKKDPNKKDGHGSDKCCSTGSPDKK